MGPLAIPAITAGLDLGYNIYRGIKSDKALKALAKQRMPRYMDAAAPLQQNLMMSKKQYETGLTPQAIGLAYDTAAMERAGQYRSVTDIAGGQMGNVIGRIGAFNTNRLGLQLGVQDQMARERGMSNMMGVNQQLSGLQQKDVAQDINTRLQKEQGYGMAKQQSIQGSLGAISGFGQNAMYQNIYGGDTAIPTATPTYLGDGGVDPGNGLLNNYLNQNRPKSLLPPRSMLSLGTKYGTPLTLRK